MSCSSLVHASPEDQRQRREATSTTGGNGARTSLSPFEIGLLSLQREEHLPVAYLCRVHRCCLERGHLKRFAGDERELRAVLPALEQPFLLVDVPLGEGDVLVSAAVTDRKDVVADSHDGDRQTFDVEAPRRTWCQFDEWTEGDLMDVHAPGSVAMRGR